MEEITEEQYNIAKGEYAGLYAKWVVLTPEEQVTATDLNTELTRLYAIISTYESKAPVSTPEEVPTTVSQGKYDQLLAAYKTLKQRVGIDHSYEKVLDAQAGLI